MFNYNNIFRGGKTEKDFSNFIDPDCTLGLTYINKPLNLIHSSAFIDIDGDCTNDLLLVSVKETPDADKSDKTLEIWRGVIKNSNKLYCLKENSVIPLQPELNLFSIADINRDGMLDLVFPVNNLQPRVLVAYNKIRLVMNWTDEYCDSHPNSKNAITQVFDITVDTSIRKESDIKELFTSKLNQIIPIYSSPDDTFYQDDKKISNLIRLGDINIDSYPDITFVLKNTNKRTPYVLMNCDYTAVSDNSLNEIGLRDFKNSCSDSIKIPFDDTDPHKSNTVYSSFFDLDDDGKLDVIVVTMDPNGSFKTYGFFNNYNYDSFFLKSINTYNQENFNQISIGTSYRYIATSLDGSRRMDVSFHQAQLNSLSLCMPFAYIGIGRSNNYIENFEVISSSYSAGQNNYNQFTPIIPNSQLLISENRDSTGKFNWLMELIINPMDILFTLIVAIGSILIMLLVSICFLHRKEVKEDQENDNLHFGQWFN